MRSLFLLLGLAAAVAQTPPSVDDRLKVAVAEVDSGAYADAIRHANEAAAWFSSHGDTRRRAWAVNLAGRAQLYSGDYRASARSFTQALELSTSVHDEASRAEELSNLGNANYFLGRYSDAAAQYAQALAITNGHANEPWSARRRRLILVNQATLDQRLGRDEEALVLYRQVQASAPDLRPNEQAQILTNLGVLYRHLGDPIKALAMYDQARALYAKEHLIDGELGVLKNRGIVLALDLDQLEAARRNFSDALTAATAASNRREMLQAQLYRGETELRLGMLDAARQDFTASLDLARTLKTPEEQWKALFGLGRVAEKSGDVAQATAQFSDAIAIIEQIRESIRIPSLRSDFFNDKREVYDALTSLEIGHAKADRIFDLIERNHSRAWRDRLGLKGTIALTDVQRALPAGAMVLDYWSSATGSAVVAITRDRASVEPIEVDAGDVKALIEAMSAGPSAEWQAAAARVSRVLPAIPAGVQHVIVVPDGPLTLVAFETLNLEIERVAISYIPTAAMLLREHPSPARLSPPWTPMLRAFADPLIPNRLPATAEEVRSISRELGGKSELHVGADDRKSYLMDEKRTLPVLHIASHAIADENAIEQSRIFFSGGQDLFLREAYELPLKGVELAVLSACDTERGRLLRGEGVQSFSRAFLAAGARTTVTTLWRVPDRETAAFMAVFYHHLQSGASRDEALRQAKLRFINSGSELSDPHYWGAFVLTGDALQPIPRAMRWRTVILIAAAIVALLIVVYVSSRSIHFSTAGGE